MHNAAEHTGEIVRENKTDTCAFGEKVDVRRFTCTKCGLSTGLPLGGTKFFCQNCDTVGDLHQDGDSCSELNPA